MAILNSLDFIKLNDSPIVDVRSPGEFSEGHIPGAFNMPLFTDEERAIIGTIYKNQGRIPAVEKGLQIVGPKMADFAKRALELAKNGELRVHCWRGGMRSESMAWLFERVGIKCQLLEGGYKAYRNLLLEWVGNLPNLIVIEGYTGSGKTDILKELRNLGEQIIDLEGFANHRGSAFGGIGQEPQPSTQQFQNLIFNEILTFDLNKRIWIEGESLSVGRVFLPDPLWKAMNSALNIEIQVLKEHRIQRLVDEYGTLPSVQMEGAINTIVQRLGSKTMTEILQNYQAKNLFDVAEKLLNYYDQAYLYSREKFKKEVNGIVLSSDNSMTNAITLIKKIPEFQTLKQAIS
jgi:tRNA 2-selenouridine synthase